jgi:UDP-N-acetylmuramoylalanine--D-glutamate ligase
LQGTEIVSEGASVLDLSITRLRGVHNAENAMAALAVARAVGISSEVVAAALADYAPPLHRCELVGTLDGVEYINDSKATNLHALESALLSQDRPTVLIAGGKEKGLDYSGMLPLLKEKVTAAVLIGEIRSSLAALIADTVPTHEEESLEDAVQRARSLAEWGGTVLFSPGTSSFDMFKGYEARGDVFRAAVKNLK